MGYIFSGLKVGGIIAAGAIGGALIGKVSGEIFEHIPYLNNVIQYGIDSFEIKADIGNLFAYAGFLNGPVIAGISHSNYIKEKNTRKYIENLESKLL